MSRSFQFLLGVIVVCFIVAAGTVYKNRPKTKPVNITFPDTQITELKDRVDNLEKWAQRQGMKYKKAR